MIEALYVSLLVNATWCGNSSFATQQHVTVLTISKNKNTTVDLVIYWALKAAAIFALIVAILYNLTLFYII